MREHMGSSCVSCARQRVLSNSYAHSDPEMGAGVVVHFPCDA